MSGYRVLLVYLIRDGMNSELPSRVSAIFLIVRHRAAASRPARQYEFPTGYNTYFGPERYQVGEQFFFHSPQLVVGASTVNRFQSCKIFQASNPNLPKNIPTLLSESLRACDPDLRQVLMGNVVLTGGGSLFPGFADRLETELSRNFPHVSSRMLNSSRSI